MLPTTRLLRITSAAAILSAALAVGCSGTVGDSAPGPASSVGTDTSMFLTGTEEMPLVTVDADAGTLTLSCTSEKKALICHIPPGNPANAHTICVGKPAVDPHVRLHGDSLGACVGVDGGVVVVVDPGGEAAAGSGPGGPAADAGSIP